MSVTDLDKMSGNLTGNIGTTLYLAPEVRSNIRAKYNNKVDLYSLGVIFFEMCHPFSSMHERAITIQVWPGTRGVEARPQSVVPASFRSFRPLTITRLFSCHGPSTATAQARDYLSRRLVLGARRLPQDHRTAVAAQVRLMSTSTLQPAPRRALTHPPSPPLLNPNCTPCSPAKRPSARQLLESPLLPAKIEGRSMREVLRTLANRETPQYRQVISALFKQVGGAENKKDANAFISFVHVPPLCHRSR